MTDDARGWGPKGLIQSSESFLVPRSDTDRMAHTSTYSFLNLVLSILECPIFKEILTDM